MLSVAGPEAGRGCNPGCASGKDRGNFRALQVLGICRRVARREALSFQSHP